MKVLGKGAESNDRMQPTPTQVLLPFVRRHWRSLLLLLVAVLAPLVLFADLAEDIFRDGGFAWDQSILAWYAAHRTPGTRADENANAIQRPSREKR